MEKRSTMAVMVVQAGPLRSSIQALMNTMPQIQIVAEAKEVSALMHMDPQIRPDLVLLEADLPGNHLGELLRQINERWTGTRSIVLVDNEAQRLMAETAGADAVIFKGFRAARFVEALERLLAVEPLVGERS